MAMSARLFIDEAAGADPTRLTRFVVRFSKPVLPGDTLTTEAWILSEEKGVVRYGFEVKNDDDVVVVTNGIAEVSPAAS